MCMHFETRDEFNQALAASYATASLASFVANARAKEQIDMEVDAQHGRIQSVIDDMVAWSFIKGSRKLAEKYARDLVEA